MTICSKYPRELVHYESGLKRKCLQRLRNNVWECKTKWQLLIRAEWNYRFKLLSLSFRSWLIYTKRRIADGASAERADEHFMRKLKLRFFLMLRRNAERRWMLVRSFAGRLELDLKRRSWQRWREYVRRCSRSRTIHVLTMSMREMNLIKSSLYAWFDTYKEKLSAEEKCYKAVLYHQSLVKRRTLKALKSYLEIEIRKKKLSAHCSREHDRRVMRRTFKSLMNFAIQKKLYRQHVQRVTSFYEDHLLKIVLERWTEKHDQLIESQLRDREDLMAKHHEGKLATRTLRKWKKWAGEEKDRSKAVEAFADISSNVIIKFYLEKWKALLQEKLLGKSKEDEALLWRSNQLKSIFLGKMMEALNERRSDGEKMADCVTLYRNNLRTRAFKRWRNFVLLRQRRKNELKAARGHCDARLAGTVIRRLRRYAQLKAERKTILIYYETKLVSEAFGKLRSFREMQISYRSRVNAFRSSHRGKVMRRAFHVFKENWAKAKMREQSVAELADGRVVRKAFQRLKEHRHRRRRKKEVWNQNLNRLQNQIALSMILIWRENAASRRSLNEELTKMKANREVALTRAHFRKWLNFIEKNKRLKENCILFERRESEIILREYTLRLIASWERIKVHREKQELALKSERERITRRYFNGWIKYTRWKKERLRQCRGRDRFPNGDDQEWTRVPSSAGKFKRKQPIIPVYLRQELTWPVSEGNSCWELSGNEDTYNISNPINERLPLIR